MIAYPPRRRLTPSCGNGSGDKPYPTTPKATVSNPAVRPATAAVSTDAANINRNGVYRKKCQKTCVRLTAHAIVPAAITTLQNQAPRSFTAGKSVDNVAYLQSAGAGRPPAVAADIESSSFLIGGWPTKLQLTIGRRVY